MSSARIIEDVRWEGIFSVFSHPGYDTDFLVKWWNRHGSFKALPKLRPEKTFKNILMATQKLLMAQAVFPSIDHLVITNQTSQPSDSETAPGGTTIYQTVDADVYFENLSSNPAQKGWNIVTDSANGSWGSFILRTSSNQMINRALAGITKQSGEGKLVLFTGSVS